MKRDVKNLRELLGDAALYGERNPAAGDDWREILLSRLPARVRPRVVSRATEQRRLVLLIALPLAAIIALSFIAYFGLPGYSGLASWGEGLDKLRPAMPTLLLNPYFWLLPMALSALLTILSRKHMPRLLPLDW
jgi:hypothetical protein